jgi:hypothetical protein
MISSQKLLLLAPISRKKLGMTISKLTPLFCALAIGTIGFSVRAEDNPAQSAARIALAKQLFELSAHPATNAPIAAPVMPPVSSEQPAPAAALQPAPEPAPAAPASPAAEQQAAQQAALAAALAQDTNAVKQANSLSNTNTSATATKAKKEKKKKKEAVAPALKPVAAPQAAPATNSYLGQDMGMKQIAAPPLPISAGKEARLQALLEKYKADQITPDEYHQQRAAILAEP